jgi:hypothetical protein
MDSAFSAAKQALLYATQLAHPTEGTIVVDASVTHMGTYLHQQLHIRKVWQLLCFFSKKLDTARRSTLLLTRSSFPATRSSDFCRFRGPKSAPLGSVAHDTWSAHQCRQLSYVAEFTSDLLHIAGAANVVADIIYRTFHQAARSHPWW